MELNKWESILVEWVNCLKFSQPISDIQECSINFFSVFLRKLLPNVLPNGTCVTWKTITDFIKEKYPEFDYEYLSNTTDLGDVPKIEITLTNTLLLHYICIMQHQPDLTTKMCKELTRNSQILLREFLEKLPKPITRRVLKEHLLSLSAESRIPATPKYYQACGGDSPISRNSPLQEFLHTPALRSTLKRENRQLIHLRCQLSEERYEKEELQEELKKQSEKIVKLDKELSHKVAEVSNLRQKIFKLENATPPRTEKSNMKTDLEKYYQSQVDHFEKEFDRLNTKLEELQEERDNLLLKQKKMDEKCFEWRTAASDAELMCMNLSEKNNQQQEEIATLQANCSELSLLLEELRAERRKEESEASFCSEGENLGKCIIDVQLQDSLKLNAGLTNQLDALNKQLNDLQLNFDGMKDSKEEFEQKVQELEKMQEEMRQSFSVQLRNKEEENLQLVQDKHDLGTKLESLNLSYTELDERLLQNEQMYNELKGRAAETQNELENKISEIANKDFRMSTLQQNFTNLNENVSKSFEVLTKLLNGKVNLKCFPLESDKVTSETETSPCKTLKVRCEEMENVVHMLENKMKSLEKREGDLLNENEDLNNSLVEFAKQKCELDAKINEYSQQIDHLNVAIERKNMLIEELERLKDVLAEKDVLVNDLQSQLADFALTKEALNEEKEKLANATVELDLMKIERLHLISDHETTVKTLNAQINNLQNMLEEKTMRESTILRDAEETKKQLNAEIEELNVAILNSEQEKKVLLEAVEILKGNVQKLTDNCKEFEDKYRETFGQCEDLALKVETLATCNAVLEEKLAEAESEMLESFQDWSEKYEDLSNRFENIDKQLRNASKTNLSLEEIIKELKEKLETCVEEKNELENRLVVQDDEVGCLKRSVSDLEVKLSNSNEALQSALRQNNASTTEIEALQNNLGNLQRKIEEEEQKSFQLEQSLSLNEIELRNITEERNQDQEQISHLKETLEQKNREGEEIALTMAATMEKIDEKGAEIVRLQQLTVSKEEEIAKLEVALAALRGDLEISSESLVKSAKEKCSLEMQLKQLEVSKDEEISKLEGTATKLTADLLSSQTSLLEAVQEKKEMETQVQLSIAQKGNEISLLEESVSALEVELSTVNNSLEEIIQEKNELEEKGAIKASELAKALGSVQELTSSLTERENNYERKILEQEIVVKEMETHFNKLKQELFELVENRDELKFALEKETTAKKAVENQLEKVEMALSDAEDKLQEKEADIAEKLRLLESTRSEWNHSESRLKTEAEELKKKLEISAQKFALLEADNVSLSLDVQRLNEDQETANTELQKIQQQLSNEHLNQAELHEKYKIVVDELKEQLIESSQKLNEAQAEWETLSATVNQRNEENANLGSLLDRIQSQLGEEQRQNEVLQQDFETRIEEKDLHLQKLSNAKAELERELCEAIAAKDGVEETLRSVCEKYTTAEGRIQKMEEEIVSSQTRLQQQEVDLHVKIDTVAKLNQELQDLMGDLKTAEETRSKLEAKHEETVRILEDIESKYEESQRELGKVAENLADNEETNAKVVRESSLEMEKLKERIVELTERELELSTALKDTQEKLNEALEELEARQRDYENTTSQLEVTAKLLSDNLTQAEEQRSVAEAQLKANTEKLEHSAKERRDMEDSNAKLEEQLMRLSNERIELNDEALKATTEIRSLDDKVAELQRQLDEAESKKRELETAQVEAVTRLEAQVATLTSQVDEVESERDTLKAELEGTVLELKEARRNRDEILKQTEDNILSAMEQARCLKSANEDTEKKMAEEKSLRSQTERELGEEKEARAKLQVELTGIQKERDEAFKTLVESRRCVLNMMKAFEVIPGNENLVFDEQSVSDHEALMEDVVRKYREQSEKVALLEKEVEGSKNDKLELQKKYEKLWKDYESTTADKSRVGKENALRNSSGANRNVRNATVDSLKSIEEDKKKMITLKQKLIICEGAKCNLEKKVRELREENKTLKNQVETVEKRMVAAGNHEKASEQIQNGVEQVSKELTQLKESYSSLRADKSVLELKVATLTKILDDRTNQLSEHSLIKEAYEKLAEDSSKTAMEVDTLKFKRNRDREEYVRLLKKEKESFEAQMNKKVQEVRAEYEVKLENMKGRMVQLYKEEVDKEMHKRFGDNNENDFLHKLIEQLRKERDSLQRKYEQLLSEGRRQPQNGSVHGSRESISSRRSTVSNRELSKRPGVAVRESTRGSTLPRSMAPPPPIDFIEETVTFSRRRSINAVPHGAFGKGMDMEDEEGDIFNNKYLDDMKEGRCILPTTHRDSEISRISELQRRNSMYPPHLKSSYPAETQFNSPTNFKEDDIKLGGLTEFDDSSRALLPGEKPRKKDAGTTSYKKPGPPTPSKNGGRTSLQGSDFHYTGRGDTTADTTKTPKQTKMSTPNRIKQLFMGRNSIRDVSEVSQQGTPKTKQRLSIFRKPR